MVGELFSGLALVLLVICPILFIVGLFLLFDIKKRPIAVKIIIFSVIGFIIGFGTCLTSINIGGGH